MKTWIKYSVALLVVALLAGVFYKKVYIPKTTFKTLHPNIGDIEVSVRGIGNVGALNIYDITAQTGGKILKIYKDEGEWVKKGDLLIVMDGVDLPQELEISKANLKKAIYEIKSAQNQLKNQKAQKRFLQITYNRYNRLNKQGFATKAEYDKAKADLDGIKATTSASVAQIESAKANKEANEKNIEAIKVKIDRLKVYAPADGYIISRDSEEAQTVLPSTKILQIVDSKTLWVQTKIDERVSSQIKIGQKATILLRSQPNKIYEGVVKRIKSISDAVTLEREIDVGFKNIPKPFYINEQAEVKIDVKSYKDVLRVPLKVVTQRDGKLGIWIFKNAHAHFLQIQKIAQDDNYISISNIDKNTQIIIPDKSKKALKENMKIHL